MQSYYLTSYSFEFTRPRDLESLGRASHHYCCCASSLLYWFTNMASSSGGSAQGLLLGSSKHHQWKIGKQIGSGVCGTVHELIDLQDPTTSSASARRDFCVKVAPLGISRNNNNNNNKGKKQTELMKQHADLLYYENLLYTSYLATLRGKYVPQLPLTKGSPPSYGEVNGKSRD
jgi:hypothetical protein